MSYRSEDILTYYLNTKTGELNEILRFGILTTNQKKRLVFYSEYPVPVYSRDNTKIILIQVNSESVDTLMSVQTDWIAEIAFFKNHNELYYIHSTIDSNLVWHSSYAKMEIYWK